MRWPFRRSAPGVTPAGGFSVGAAVGETGSRAGWVDLPPLQRSTADLVPVAPVGEFRASLAAHQDPRFLAPLGHALDAEAPGGEVGGYATPVAGEKVTFPPVGPFTGTTNAGVQRAAEEQPPAHRPYSLPAATESVGTKLPPVEPRPVPVSPVPLSPVPVPVSSLPVVQTSLDPVETPTTGLLPSPTAPVALSAPLVGTEPHVQTTADTTTTSHVQTAADATTTPHVTQAPTVPLVGSEPNVQTAVDLTTVSPAPSVVQAPTVALVGSESHVQTAVDLATTAQTPSAPHVPAGPHATSGSDVPAGAQAQVWPHVQTSADVTSAVHAQGAPAVTSRGLTAPEVPSAAEVETLPLLGTEPHVQTALDIEAAASQAEPSAQSAVALPVVSRSVESPVHAEHSHGGLQHGQHVQRENTHTEPAEHEHTVHVQTADEVGGGAAVREMPLVGLSEPLGQSPFVAALGGPEVGPAVQRAVEAGPVVRKSAAGGPEPVVGRTVEFGSLVSQVARPGVGRGFEVQQPVVSRPAEAGPRAERGLEVQRAAEVSGQASSSLPVVQRWVQRAVEVVPPEPAGRAELLWPPRGGREVGGEAPLSSAVPLLQRSVGEESAEPPVQRVVHGHPALGTPVMPQPSRETPAPAVQARTEGEGLSWTLEDSFQPSEPAVQRAEVVRAVSLEQMFGGQAVQRDEAEAPPAETAAAPASAQAAAPAGAKTVSAAEVEELAKRLYEPLTAKLRAELWLDRERSGRVTDRW
jgi:hypothetical protein